MKKYIISIAFVLAGLGGYWGLQIHSAAKLVRKQTLVVQSQIDQLKAELFSKNQFGRVPPVNFEQAFRQLIDQMSLMGAYNGVKMSILPRENKDMSRVAAMRQETEFRGINGLPLDIRVQKVTQAGDLSGALEAIRFVEKRTDYKVQTIIQESEGLLVKGVLYGL